MTTTTDLSEVKINKLTKAQYKTAKNNNEIVYSQIYNLSDVDLATLDDKCVNMVGANGSTAGTAGFVPAPQASDNNKYLKGDGTWSQVDALPTQSGQSGKFLTTNGSSASWTNIPAEIPTQSGQSGKFLTTNGSSVSWGTPPNDDTKNTAGSSDTSSKIYLVGATSQTANSQTYSHNTVFVDTSGQINSLNPNTDENSTVVATTKWVTDKGYLTSITAHNQASNTINVLTGYSKPSATSAITSSDTLNAAIGKLEKALDSKQASGSYQTTDNLVTSVSNSTTDSQYISAKQYYENVVHQPITTSSGTLTLQNKTTIYKIALSSETTISFTTTNLNLTTSKSYTFELYLDITWPSSITFPSSVKWLGEVIPDLSNIGLYFLVFRTVDGGTSWLGNLQGVWTR